MPPRAVYFNSHLRRRVRPATLKRYATVLQRFLQFLAILDRPFYFGAISMENPGEALDDALSVYADFGNITRSVYCTTVSAVKFYYPAVRRSLSTADETLRGWAFADPSRHTMPCLRLHTLMLVAAAHEAGMLAAARGFLVQYAGYLRPGELLRLTSSAVVLPEWCPDYVGSPRAFLILGTPERLTKVNREEVVEITDPIGIAALRALVRTGSAQLVPLSADRYRKAFQRATAAAGLGALGITPHSLRAGAATQDSIDGVSFETIRARGRWRVESTARMYLAQANVLAQRALVQTATLLARGAPQLPPDLLDFDPLPARAAGGAPRR